MQTTKTFSKLVHALNRVPMPRYIDNEGGTRSGKTFSELQLLIAIVESDPFQSVNSVMSETMPHLKLGAIRDFERILKTDKKWNESAWNKTDKIYTFPNGAIIEFFSADNIGKVLGPARDRLLLIEANHIPFDIARQAFVRTTRLILWDYNPASSFWVHEHYKNDPDCVSIHSTYLDNDFLSPEQIKEIERGKSDPNWWRVYGLGLLGKLEGQIYDFEQIDSLPDPTGLVEVYGMDFGFTNDPTTLVHILIDTGRKIIYADELCYQRGMLNSDIASMMQENEILRNAMVFADCAEPKTIEELYQYGFNILPCYKATKKADQIQIMRGYQHRITKRSTNLIREHRGYVWAQDKEGRPLNEPIAFNDHCEDALRYGVIGYLTQCGGSFGIGYSRNYETDTYYD